MRRMRWLAWLANLLLLVTLVATGAHSHYGDVGSSPDRSCVACTLAHTPIASPSTAPAPQAPEATHEIAAEIPEFAFAPPLSTPPAPRGPPLA